MILKHVSCYSQRIWESINAKHFHTDNNGDRLDIQVCSLTFTAFFIGWPCGRWLEAVRRGVLHKGITCFCNQWNRDITFGNGRRTCQHEGVLEAIHPPPCGVVLIDWQVCRHSWWGFGRSVDGFDKLRTLSVWQCDRMRLGPPIGNK